MQITESNRYEADHLDRQTVEMRVVGSFDDITFWVMGYGLWVMGYLMNNDDLSYDDDDNYLSN